MLARHDARLSFYASCLDKSDIAHYHHAMNDHVHLKVPSQLLSQIWLQHSSPLVQIEFFSRQPGSCVAAAVAGRPARAKTINAIPAIQVLRFMV